MINSGYIKLHRSFQDWYGMSSPPRVSLWINILILANHSQKKWIFKGSPYSVEPGQFITSRKSLSAITGISESMVERILKEFENEGQIEQQTTNVNRLITVIKYRQYQFNEHQMIQQEDNGRTTKGQQKDTTKNNKNNKHNKNKYAKWFESVWSIYPKQIGKKEAYGYFNTTVKTDEDYSNIKKAVQNYLKHLEVDSVGPKYIKKGCNWFDDWESWVDYKAPKTPKRAQEEYKHFNEK